MGFRAHFPGSQFGLVLFSGLRTASPSACCLYYSSRLCFPRGLARGRDVWEAVMPPAWAVWAPTAPGTGRELGKRELKDRVVWSEGGGAGAPVRCIASGGGGGGIPGTGPWSQALLVPRPCLVFPVLSQFCSLTQLVQKPTVSEPK